MNKKTKWFNNKWWISPFNYEEDVNSSFNFPEKIHIRDSTIREGEETPAVYYSLEQKVNIVEKLEDISVGHIDRGYIGQVQDQWELANKIKEIGLKMKTYCHLSSNAARWTADEINKTLEKFDDPVELFENLNEMQTLTERGESYTTYEILEKKSIYLKIRLLNGFSKIEIQEGLYEESSIFSKL